MFNDLVSIIIASVRLIHTSLHAGDDYIPGTLTGDILVANEPVCVNLTVNSDSFVEDTETVLLTLSSLFSSNTDTTTLNILDDDGGLAWHIITVFLLAVLDPM